MEKGDLKKSFWSSTVGHLVKYFAVAVITYALFIPVDIYLDAARSVFIHSTAAEPLVDSAWNSLGGLVTSIGEFFNGAVGDSQIAAVDPGLQQDFIENDGYSADNLFADPTLG